MNKTNIKSGLTGIRTMIRAGIGPYWLYERTGTPGSRVGHDLTSMRSKRGAKLFPNERIEGQLRGRFSSDRKFRPTWAILYRNEKIVSTWGDYPKSLPAFAHLGIYLSSIKPGDSL